MITGDGSGGAYIAWRDARDYATNGYDVYAQHLTATGARAADWPESALPVCTAPRLQSPLAILLDSEGAVLVLWLHQLLGGFSGLFMQRLISDGTLAPGWPVNGLAVRGGTGFGGGFGVVPDDSGGCYLAWDDPRTDVSDVYAQRITRDGKVAAGWPADGLPVALGTGFQGLSLAVRDNAGGVILSWNDSHTGIANAYVMRLTPAGEAGSGWPNGGLLVAPGLSNPCMVSDGAGGAYLGLGKVAPDYSGYENLYVLRITGSGAPAPGWPAGGLLVCNAPDTRNDLRMAPDGSGGAIMQWDDYRGLYSEVYAVRLAPDGTRAPGWMENGTPISTLVGYQLSSDLVADGMGGAYFAFELHTSVERGYIQHLNGGGQPAQGWSSDGITLNPLDEQRDPTITSDGGGGAIVAWFNYWANVLYAQRFVMDGVVASELALVSADAQSDRVLLLWQGDGAYAANASVERRTTTSDWQRIGTPIAEGEDRLRYDDRDVTPGSRYGYRLVYLRSGVTQYTADTWVDVPLAAVFALEGARPNPAVSRMNVAFSLPNGSPASLAMLDVAGREVMRREVGSLGAGRHVVPMDPGAPLAPGLYWLKLTQGERALLARAVVIR